MLAPIRTPREVFPAAVGPARNQQSSPSSGRGAAAGRATVEGETPEIPGAVPSPGMSGVIGCVDRGRSSRNSSG